MIILNANIELKKTFERLIKTMREPVEWNGQFVVIGDYLILSGEVRSLFFNFESRKVITNLIDIPKQNEPPVEIGDHVKVQNVLNLVLYAFGKWGMIRGVKVDQDYAKLNRLFTNVLKEISVEPGYSHENFRFFKDGIRLNYEDVIMLAIEARDETVLQEEQKEESSAGLWHKLLWTKQKASFERGETTFSERQKNRIGRNFYMVGYKCPKCRAYLHMAVFPEGKEFRIETTEGGVFLARAYTCAACRSYYTPRPEKLLQEGDIYHMDFSEDDHAYEDYKELLGAEAERVSNCNFNEFEEARKQKGQTAAEEKEEPLEELCGRIHTLSDDKLAEIAGKAEEGFYREESIGRFAPVIQEEAQKRRIAESVSKADEAARMIKKTADGFRKAGHTAASKPDSASREADFQPQSGRADQAAASSTGHFRKSEMKSEKPEKKEIPALRREAAQKRYMAKCKILDRLSPMQVAELKKELLQDSNLYNEEKEPFLNVIAKREKHQRKERIRELASGCQGLSYAKIKRVIEEIEKMNPVEEEREILDSLYKSRKKQAETEVLALVQKIPEKMDMKQYNSYMERLKEYADADLSPYEEILKERKRQAQHREIEKAIRHSRTGDRQGLLDLMERLKKQDFENEILDPYLNELNEKLRLVDQDAIAEICGRPNMTIAETMEAYKKIEEGVFLPELKTNALEMLKKRLKKLKMDECDLLVHKLKKDLDGRIRENERHYFYPAKRIASKEAAKEEYQVIDFALDTYGTTRDVFEYPILVVDTSRDRSGKEGMILTPEHLFYRTMFQAYAIPIGTIKRMHSQTGLLNTGLFVETKDGNKIKIPYAVDRKEIVAWGNCLEEFIHYLQEKPDSRNVTYLAKEKHETICCFRCGYTYKTGNVCPKCGYKMNQ